MADIDGGLIACDVVEFGIYLRLGYGVNYVITSRGLPLCFLFACVTVHLPNALLNAQTLKYYLRTACIYISDYCME